MNIFEAVIYSLIVIYSSIGSGLPLEEVLTAFRRGPDYL
jgi:hypothetical protein